MLRLFTAILILGLSPAALAQLNGKTLYEMNCSACHQLKVEQAGPNLVTLAQLYRGKQANFVKWARDPLPHKRKQFAPMPPMAHVPEHDLKKIYDHMMAIAKGVNTGPKKQQVDLFPDQLSKRPLVQRIFLSETGPASIAVAVNDRFSYCFDAGPSRLRFIWTGGFLDGFPYWKGNGDGLAKIKGTKVLTEAASPLPFLKKAPAKFLGYSMKEGLPTFKYRSGNITVHERIEPTKTGLRRIFTLQGAPADLVLNFPAQKGVSYSGDGEWKGTSLHASTASPIIIDYTFSDQ